MAVIHSFIHSGDFPNREFQTEETVWGCLRCFSFLHYLLLAYTVYFQPVAGVIVSKMPSQ